MRQFKTVFKFEFNNYAKSKSFIAVTLVLMIAIALVLSWPRLSGLFAGGSAEQEGNAAGPGGGSALVGLVDQEGDTAQAVEYYNAAMNMMGYRFESFDGDAAALEAAVDAGQFESGILLTGQLGYTRYVRNTDMYDAFGSMFNEVMLGRYRAETMAALGVPADEIASFVSAVVQSETVTTAQGKDGAQNFLYTYILIMLLYFTIVMYGNMVASSVATEKSTRAMELLITSAKPSSLMFGKVFGAGIAGLSQFVLVLGTAFLAYKFNEGYFVDNYMVQSIFAMPLSLLLYTLLFYVLGFFIYAFLYASLASLVSRMEDLSQAIQPALWVLVIAFMVVVFSISSGNVNNVGMVVCSYIPFTSPMAMFARIAMGDVAHWEVAISVGILVVATLGTGYMAAGIYRLGVLLYGNRPKFGEILKLMKANKKKQQV